MRSRSLTLLVLALLSCLDGGASLASPSKATLRQPGGEAVILRDYWRLPIPPQGSPPPGFHPLASSLRPESCAACHPRQFAEWRTSLHAAAMGPGVKGQLPDMREVDPRQAQSCENCHAPLAEQQERILDREGILRPNRAFDAALQATGVNCAACHVRSFHRNGPPRDPARPSGISWSGPPPLPHGPVTRTPSFERSEFCAACHQFPADQAVNGKPLENTFVEWGRSRYARQGISCQQCHMPARQHLWRGIHDPAMVKRGITVSLHVPPARPKAGSPVQVGVVVRNTGVGHHFPTYMTPVVVVRCEQQDARGRSLAGTRSEWRIGREVTFTDAGPREIADTRIPAGQRRTFSYRRPMAPRATRLRAWIQVYPDHYYTWFYQQVVQEASRSTASVSALKEARRLAQQRSFLIYDRLLLLKQR